MPEQIYNKVVVNNTTLIDLSEDTVTSAADIIAGKVGHLADGSKVTGTASSGNTMATFTLDYANDIYTCDTPFSEIFSIVDRNNVCVKVTWDGTNFDDYVATYDPNTSDTLSYVYVICAGGLPVAAFKYFTNGVDDTVIPLNDIPTVTILTATVNGTYTDPDGKLYREVIVNVPSDSPSLQSKTATPTETAQTITADSGYDGLSSVEVGAISSTYVGSGVTRRTSADLTRSTYTINVPAGYYEEPASKAVERVTHATPEVSINSSTGLIKAVHTQNQGWVEGSGTGADSTSKTLQLTTQAAKTVTPTESSQQAVASGVYTTGAVTVAAIPSNYVGSGITERDSDDLTVSGATVSVPAGYYSSAASKSVASGTAGTPTATKGTVSNHAITVTPSVTNTTGYITGGTKNGTGVTVSASELVSGTKSISSSGETDVTNYASASVSSGSITVTASKGTVASNQITVSPYADTTSGFIGSGRFSGSGVTVSASELVSGTYSVTSSGTKDVTNYASASVPAGTEGTPTATKGSVSNHSISVTPSVTNSSGFITGSTKTGTAVSVSASELVSGTRSITANGTGIDVTNYANVDVAVENTDFIVTLTKNSSTGVWEPDCTYAELLAAYNGGKTLMGITNLGDPASVSYYSNDAFYYGLYDLDNNGNANWIGYTLSSQGVIDAIENNIYYGCGDGVAQPNEVLSGNVFYNSSGRQVGTYLEKFIVTLTKNAQGDWTPDKTYAQIKAAYDGGHEIIFKAIDGTNELPAFGYYVENAQNNPFYYEVDEPYNDLVHTNVVYIKGYFLTSSGSSLAANYTYHATDRADASVSDVVSGKIFYNASGYQTGTLVIQHYYTGSTAPSSSLGANGDIYLQS